MPPAREAPGKEKRQTHPCEERKDGASAFAKASADEPAFAKATADEPAKPKSGKATDPPLQGTQGWGIRLRQGYGATSPQNQNRKGNGSGTCVRGALAESMDSGRDHENFESACVFADCYVAFGEAGGEATEDIGDCGRFVLCFGFGEVAGVL
jgi:hypothetical protein